MNKLFNVPRLNILPIAGIVSIIFLFMSCKKSEDNVNTRFPSAGLMAFNLSPDKAAIGITLSGNNLTTVPLGYTSFTGAYLPVFTGSREVRSYDVNTGASLATDNRVFQDSMYYSLFTLGANGNYRNLVVNDKLDSLSSTSGEAFVRYINAIPDSSKPIVTITSNGTDLVNNSASFASVSGFSAVSPGNISISVNNGAGISANRTIMAETGKVYTILLVGVAGDPDPAKGVQVKFIQNGTVSP